MSDLAWRILLIEDKPDIRRQIRERANQGKLLPNAFTAEIQECDNFEAAAGCLTNSRFDFVILDLRDEEGGTKRPARPYLRP